jgi:hypothetical protein
MVKGETIMPVPGGEITSTQTWGLTQEKPEEVELAEAIIAVEDDERLVEIIEEVVESDSE